MVGNQHYVTFDGRAYDFVGECTYLLAHDFVDNNFTVIVKYKRESDEVITKYFTVVIDGESFDAHDNLAVTINSTHQNLPLTLGQTRISRTQNSLKVSNDAKQIWVLYDKQADVFMLEIGGFYHGKTAGLFGNFDHEPFNDFLKSNNEESLKIEEFVASWEIGSQPCLNKNYAYRANINSYQIQKTCNDIFDKYSSLTSCLRKVKLVASRWGWGWGWKGL